MEREVRVLVIFHALDFQGKKRLGGHSFAQGT